MEQWIADLISNVPLAVGILVIWYLMTRSQTELERQRESNRARDEAARNEQINTLIKLQQETNGIITLMRQTSEDNTNALLALTERMGKRFDETLEIISPLPDKARETLKNVAELRGVLETLERNQGAMQEVIQRVLEQVATKDDTPILDELASIGEKMSSVLDELQSLRHSVEEASVQIS